PRCLPEELLGLPHRLEPVVDPQEDERALQLLNRVRQEVERRIASSATDAPELVVVVPELTQLTAEHQLALGPVMLYGPLHPGASRLREHTARGGSRSELYPGA